MSDVGFWNWIANPGPWAWTRGALWALVGLSMFCAFLARVTYGQHAEIGYLILGAPVLGGLLVATRPQWWKKDESP